MFVESVLLEEDGAADAALSAGARLVHHHMSCKEGKYAELSSAHVTVNLRKVPLFFPDMFYSRTVLFQEGIIVLITRIMSLGWTRWTRKVG